MTYVSGLVAAVPNANKQAFIDHARIAAEIFREFGAIKIVENWGNDVPDGEVTSFPMAVKKADDETVVFSWIIWPDKAACDKAMQAMMEDPRMDPAKNPMPFDGKRMIFGGFDTVLEV
ncbi:RNA signal recognition particle [Maricaulis sp. W15]|uniref:DUF1428 domain-containing protein n=1 Tax=Maricaulis sp. W15 TaxID=1772333 RepID=UPI0009491F79|nr:DUF1428 domain-containing protein [Maricaulis sp. W15]OLF74077.1 RNA signal recognition particle [Maricaulis sp. W15]